VAVTKSRVHMLKKVCASGSCWESETFEDGGVVAVAGPGWKCFMAERHFTDSACGSVAKPVGGFCDSVAAHVQPTNQTIRVIEVKTQPKFAQAKDQLRKGVRFVLGLPGVKAEAISVELHVKDAPRITVRPRQRDLDVDSRRFRIQLVINGEPQFS
jgi:hypothetical protein